MRLSHFFISRPIFAIVLSLFITIVGAVAYFVLPVAQYPEVAPPTIEVTASYPGASAEVLSKTAATPLEQQLNGIENLLYFSSHSTGDGKLVVTLTFKLGTDLNTAESLTQSRVLIRFQNSRSIHRTFETPPLKSIDSRAASDRVKRKKTAAPSRV
jgi:multidrug efflux pump subunit AcrB